MAEGDTIAKARLRLAPIFEGSKLTEFWSRRTPGLYRPRVGQKVLSVRSAGKHLIFDLDKNLSLETHLGMDGYWLARPTQTLAAAAHERRSPYLQLVVASQAGYALCYKAKRVRSFVRTSQNSPVDHLGPDLCTPSFDLTEVLRRARLVASSTLLLELLADQSVACGIGNIYKSEALHLCRLDPFATVNKVTDQQLQDVTGSPPSCCKTTLRAHANPVEQHQRAGSTCMKECTCHACSARYQSSGLTRAVSNVARTGALTVSLATQHRCPQIGKGIAQVSIRKIQFCLRVLRYS